MGSAPAIRSTMLSAPACLSTVLACSALPQSLSLTDDQREVFAILDEFDPLDTTRMPFVRVCQEENGRRTQRHGFLTAIDKHSLHVRYVELGRDVIDLR